MTTTAFVLRSPDQCIARIRGYAAILDSDLVALYGVPVKRLNEQVQRNKERFPDTSPFSLLKTSGSLYRHPYPAGDRSFLPHKPHATAFRPLLDPA